MSVLRAGRGRGGRGWKFSLTEKHRKKMFLGSLRGVAKNFYVFLPYKFFKNVPGFFLGGGCWGVWGAPRAGSENDALIPMTMTRDRPKFWNGRPWRSKVIIRKPWPRKNKYKI